VKAAEIPYGKFHNLRDTFATRLYYASGSIAKICDRLGHSDIKGKIFERKLSGAITGLPIQSRRIHSTVNE